MNLIEHTTINDTTYHLSQAPAVKQRALLGLVGAKIMFNNAAAVAQGVSEDGTISRELVKGALLTLPEKTLQEVSEIVLHKCVIEGDGKKITVEDFQGKMNTYLDLLVFGIEVNLSDFFTWCGDVSTAKVNEDQDKKTNQK